MRILFICPAVSQQYQWHIRQLAQQGWPGAKFLQRDLKRNERAMRKIFYGLGLLTLASGLDPEIALEFIDENMIGRTPQPESYARQDVDLIAITAQLVQADRALELIEHFTSRAVHVVVGGPHPTTFPDEYLRQGVSVVRGEGEQLFKEFLQDFNRGRPLPLYQQPPTSCIDLADSPSPRYSLLAGYRYHSIGVNTTRGCPHRCNFCNIAQLSGVRLRHKPVPQVKAEIQTVRRLWPESRFFFYDDNTFADKHYAWELFTALGEIDLGSWFCQTDISIAHEPALLDLLAANGKPFFSIGFETLSSPNAAAIGNRIKARYVSRYEECITKIRAKGIGVGGSFMFGFPGDSSSELEAYFAFMQRTGLEGYVTRYAAIPYSQLYCDLLGEYQQRRGPLADKGKAQAKVLNEYYQRSIGYGFDDTEKMILNQLRRNHPCELPTLALDALASFRCLFLDGARTQS